MNTDQRSPEGQQKNQEAADFPSEVPPDRTWFDALADHVTNIVSNASFFTLCLVFILVWTVAGAVLHWSHWHEWADALAVPAAGITLMMVALLENESSRNNKASQRKMNAMAKALADLMERFEMDAEDVQELRLAVGLEERESTKDEHDRADKAKSRR